MRIASYFFTCVRAKCARHFSRACWRLAVGALPYHRAMADPLTSPTHPSWETLRPDPQQPWHTLSRRELSQVRRFVHDRVRLHGGGEQDYYYHPRGPRAVFVFAVTARGEGVLLREYRYPLGAVVSAVVAGGVEEGEDLLAAAQRELLEEAGGVAEHWEPLAGFYPQPSISGAAFFPWLARQTTLGAPQHEAGELIERLTLPLPEIYRRLDAGEIADGPSALVLFQARERLRELGLL